jgi:hypothetical protein
MVVGASRHWSARAAPRVPADAEGPFACDGHGRHHPMGQCLTLCQGARTGCSGSPRNRRAARPAMTGLPIITLGFREMRGCACSSMSALILQRRQTIENSHDCAAPARPAIEPRRAVRRLRRPVRVGVARSLRRVKHPHAFPARRGLGFTERRPPYSRPTGWARRSNAPVVRSDASS